MDTATISVTLWLDGQSGIDETSYVVESPVEVEIPGLGRWFTEQFIPLRRKLLKDGHSLVAYTEGDMSAGSDEALMRAYSAEENRKEWVQEVLDQKGRQARGKIENNEPLSVLDVALVFDVTVPQAAAWLAGEACTVTTDGPYEYGLNAGASDGWRIDEDGRLVTWSPSCRDGVYGQTESAAIPFGYKKGDKIS